MADAPHGAGTPRPLATFPLWVWDGAATLVALTIGLLGYAGPKGDWHYYDLAQRSLFGPDGLHLYARHPDLQFGPLSMVVARVVAVLPDPTTAAAVLVGLLLLPALMLARRAVHAVGAAPRPSAWIVGWVLAAIAWVPLVWIGQIGDALALLAVQGAVLAVLARSPVVAGVLLGVGVACKPWPLLLLPLLLFAPRAPRAIGAALGVTAVAFAPFMLADRGTLGAGKPSYVVPSVAWERLLGIGDAPPSWWRAAQLVVCWAVGVALWWWARRRGDLARGLLVAVAVLGITRTLTELGTWPYFTSAVFPLVLAADLVVGGRRAPWAALAAAVTVLDAQALLGTAFAAVSRPLLLVVAAALLLLGYARSAVPDAPAEGLTTATC